MSPPGVRSPRQNRRPGWRRCRGAVLEASTVRPASKRLLSHPRTRAVLVRPRSGKALKRLLLPVAASRSDPDGEVAAVQTSSGRAMVHPDALVHPSSGETLLHRACSAGHVAAVRALLRCGANVLLHDVSSAAQAHVPVAAACLDKAHLRSLPPCRVQPDGPLCQTDRTASHAATIAGRWQDRSGRSRGGSVGRGGLIPEAQAR